LLTYDQILDHVWGRDTEDNPGVVKVSSAPESKIEPIPPTPATL